MAKDRLWKFVVCCALALGTALLYLPVLHFDYVNYDDPLYVINNQHIRTLSWQSLQWAFENNYASLWHPLTWISHILDFHFYGLFNPGGHHATSVVLHIFNSILLFVVLHRMTKALWPSAVVAALFAWHPLHVESVAWISERKDVLSSFFWMLTMWAYAGYAEDVKKSGSSRNVFYGLSLFFFVLGLMSKPMLVTLPFVLLLLDWWPLRRFPDAGEERPAAGGNKEGANLDHTSGSGINPRPDRSPTPATCSISSLLLEKVPFLLLSLLFCLITLRAASHSITSLAGSPMWVRLINATLTYMRYVEKLVWPVNLVVVYPGEAAWSRNEVVMAGLFLIIFSFTAVRLWRERPFWMVGWLWYLGILVPVIGLVAVGTPPLADHNTYLPSIGIFMIAAWEACDIAAGWKSGHKIVGLAAIAILGACLVASHRQIQYWRNPETLFLHNLEVTPNNAAAHVDYAGYLRDSGQMERAKDQCQVALQLSPNNAIAHNVLGGILMYEGKLDKAGEELRASLALDPRLVGTHLILGGLALARNLPAEAVTQFSAFLAYDPSDPKAHCGLGQALAMQGKLSDARAQYAEALRLAPGFAEAHYQMGVSAVMQHNTAEALAEYKVALQCDPKHKDALNNLAWILATDPHLETRNGAKAVELAAQACALAGNKNPRFMGTLAAAYAEEGRFDEAIAAGTNAEALATQAGNKALADRNHELLPLYRAHQPYREK